MASTSSASVSSAPSSSHVEKKDGKSKSKCDQCDSDKCACPPSSSSKSKSKCAQCDTDKCSCSTSEQSHASKGQEDRQALPGEENKMACEPRFEAKWYKGSGKLEGKVALITGGDSGIGKAVAVLFAREGAAVAINYLPQEQKDAEKTKEWIETNEKGRCLLLPGDLCDSKVCTEIVTQTVSHFGKIDCLVNNAGTQKACKDFTKITEEQIESTFRTNIISMMLVTKEALKHLPDHTGTIINTTSINAFRGHGLLIDYSSTKGAILAFTRSLAHQVAERGIRVNSVAPGPIWTPLIVSSLPDESLSPEKFGKDTLLGRCGQPDECSPAFVFLASQDSSYFSGQTLHPNGGYIVNA